MELFENWAAAYPSFPIDSSGDGARSAFMAPVRLSGHPLERELGAIKANIVH